MFIFKKVIFLFVIFHTSFTFCLSQEFAPFYKKKNFEILHTSNSGYEYYADAKWHWGYKDSVGNTVIKAKFHMARKFKEERAIVRLYDEFGIIDEKGKWILKPNYKDIGDFSEGLANVISNGGCGYVDRNGNIKIDLIYDHAEPFKNGLALVWKGVRRNYIDKTGKPVLSDWKKYDFIYEFSEGYAPVLSWKSFGFIDSLGNEAIELKYQKAYPFSDGFALVKLDDKFGFINHSGKFAIKAEFDTATSFNNHISIVRKAENYGVIKRNGEYLHECKFDSVYPFYDSVALIEQNGKKGYINDKGEILVKPMLQLANPYRFGYAKVKQDNRYFFLDKNGKNAFAMVFEDASSFFKMGATVMHKGKYQLIDTLGKLHSFNDTMLYYNVDEPVHCVRKKRYTSEILKFSFAGEFLGQLSRRVDDLYLRNFSEFRIEVILDEDGYWVDYKIIRDIDEMLENSATEILDRLSEYSQAATKDGEKVASMLDFSIVWDCEANSSGGYSCSIYSIVNSMSKVILENENNTE